MPLRNRSNNSTRFKKVLYSYLVFVFIVFLLTLSYGLRDALGVSLLWLSLFGFLTSLIKSNIHKSKRLNIFLISSVLLVAGLFVVPSGSESGLENLMGTIFFASILGLIVGLIKPKSMAMFTRSDVPSRKNIALASFGILIGSMVSLGMVADPPPAPEVALASINITENHVTDSENFEIQGVVEGDPSKIEINDKQVEPFGSSFSSSASLVPGDNKISLEVHDSNGVKVKKNYSIFYDYEGKIYSELNKKEASDKDALNKKLATVPKYEIVRKESIDKGFSAIVYLEGETEDYLVSNTVKHIKYYHKSSQNISLLIFKKSDKIEVEKILESTDMTALSGLVRANYEKRIDKQDLYLFPTGLEGNKLALEV